MSKTLLIAEKKEVGVQILSCLQNKDWEALLKQVKGGFFEDDKYIVTWAMGHLFTQKLPAMLNENWGLWKPLSSIEAYKMLEMSSFLDKLKTPSNDKFKKNQIQVIKKIFDRNDIDKIIICTDADAEGEAIGRDILSLNKNKKIPTFRLWNTGSFKSKDAIDEAMKKLLPITDTKYERLFAQQRSRSGADYMLGMKLTKSISEHNHTIFETGRLKALLVSILAKRELDIKNFIPKKYWKINGTLKGLKFSHFYKNEDNEETTIYYSKDVVEDLMALFKSYENKGVVDLNETKETSSKERPLPLSGTDFANEMMKTFKIPLDTCNKILAFLREEGLTSYQGTNGRYFSENDKDEVLLCIDVAKKYFSNEKIISTMKFDLKNSIFNNKKAEKQNHPPLTVRAKIPNDSLFKELESKSKLPFLKESYELILKRVICNFLEDDLLLKQKIIISIDGNKFKLEGSKALKQGWRSFVGMEISDNTFDATAIKSGDTVKFDSINLEDDLTTAPKLYNVQKLIAMMLNVSKEINNLINETDDKARKKELEDIKKTLKGAEGIGTDRTRPTIISQLEEMGFYQTKGKEKEISLLQKGWDYFEVIPSELKEFKLCAEWETGFEAIRNGDLTYAEFIKKVDEDLSLMIENIHSCKKSICSEKKTIETPKTTTKSSSNSSGGEICETPKTFKLNDKFVFKNIFGKDLTKTEASKILKGEEVLLNRVSSKEKGGQKYTITVKLASSNDGKIEVIRK